MSYKTKNIYNMYSKPLNINCNKIIESMSPKGEIRTEMVELN